MAVERVDFYSDQEYEQALQLEEDSFRQDQEQADAAYADYYNYCMGCYYIGEWYKENLSMIEDGFECREIRY